jgi:hypothetical protein
VTPRRRACAIALAFIVVGCASGPLHGRAASLSSVVAPSPVDTTAGTAAVLATDHWSNLPVAPITPRENPVAAWTGSRMLVWGGASSDRNDATLYADGASYDPATQTWTTLPAAPLSPREDMGWVWTGTSLVIFGGVGGGRDAGSSHALADGAVYSPASNSWHKLPSAPLTPRFNPELIWTGHEVLVIGGDPDGESADGPGYAAGEAAYDPATNRWTTLPPMPTTPGHDVRHLRAVDTARGVYVWQAWQHVTMTSDGEDLSAGYDVLVYNADANSWTRDPGASSGVTGNAPAGIGQLVVGDGIVYSPAAQPWYGDSSTAPAFPDLQGAQLDLATDSWTLTPHGPIDDLEPLGVWTGQAFLEYTDQGEGSQGGGPSFGPGASAVLDPAISAWTALPTAPHESPGDNAVWAGDRLLVWGLEGLSFGE